MIRLIHECFLNSSSYLEKPADISENEKKYELEYFTESDRENLIFEVSGMCLRPSYRNAQTHSENKGENPRVVMECKPRQNSFFSGH